MGVYEELVARGLIAQVTDEDKIKDLVNNGKATFYIGFDPTADSLHVGHFMALVLMKRLQAAGNKPIALVGGGTGMIGDPSGRTDMRKMMTIEQIDHNCECFKQQMSRFIEFGEGKARMVNNADWLRDLNFLEFMRDIGSCFSVNDMLRARAYVNRMERGLTFLEFSYMLMQGYDFYRLYNDYGCNMEFGGDDQWSNMLAGTELIRKKLGKDAYALTITLLTNSEGKKMGKTVGGAVWLDPKKTSPYDFYQYWRNVDDADVIKCMKLLTFIPLEEIDEMAKWEGADLNKAKEKLAFSLTEMVHGREEAEKADTAAKAIFMGGGDSENMPKVLLKDEDYKDGSIDILGILVASGLCSSRGDARRNVQQGGVTAAGEKVTDISLSFTKEALKDGIVVQKGKKKFVKVIG
ncbi:tyrosine--tRNA ligase [Oribacterium sp. HCP28S3_H8]|jgi:tyrosyl-tRNA synthetase|uniref:tyrosine--tRNA ligase n=1 Tax=Oribacterium sp. HCP28S3_H8 TaxID=3438945 RepID=UPI003068B18C|nr:tyrosine--tRNA ligase [Oribacterium sp.]